jgi:hypothetical protein
MEPALFSKPCGVPFGPAGYARFGCIWGMLMISIKLLYSFIDISTTFSLFFRVIINGSRSLKTLSI